MKWSCSLRVVLNKTPVPSGHSQKSPHLLSGSGEWKILYRLYFLLGYFYATLVDNIAHILGLAVEELTLFSVNCQP